MPPSSAPAIPMPGLEEFTAYVAELISRAVARLPQPGSEEVPASAPVAAPPSSTPSDSTPSTTVAPGPPIAAVQGPSTAPPPLPASRPLASRLTEPRPHRPLQARLSNPHPLATCLGLPTSQPPSLSARLGVGLVARLSSAGPFSLPVASSSSAPMSSGAHPGGEEDADSGGSESDGSEDGEIAEPRPRRRKGHCAGRTRTRALICQAKRDGTYDPNRKRKPPGSGLPCGGAL
ncbi:hypothetical protein LshimejAT787_3100060 [Lyophyllum shimeji]|uniref:Uncharacterized protein n=1 Tax=Lyophyllum shimeji TaxID=47721 RepID=A0A9P3Q1U5_LYOSH|nr:hypothetical protein LshimejAT787_3100060 [Lyophyllum shimeji]